MHAGVEIKPCCEACERNKYAISGALAELFTVPGDVLEIGSGTGQHAVHFAAQMPHLNWQCSDLPERHAGINAWISESDLDNVLKPIVLDVSATDWPRAKFAYAFSANTAHIMSWQNVGRMLAGLANVLVPEARFALYGPFNVDGRFTSEGNQEFDAALRAEDPLMGIRDIEEISKLASASGFSFADDIPMPANNRLLLFAKV